MVRLSISSCTARLVLFLLLCSRVATCSGGIVAGFKTAGDVGSCVFVHSPNRSCAGDACTFSAGVFLASSMAR